MRCLPVAAVAVRPDHPIHDLAEGNLDGVVSVEHLDVDLAPADSSAKDFEEASVSLDDVATEEAQHHY